MKKFYKSKWILPANGHALQDYVLVVENGIIQDIIPLSEVQHGAIIDFGNAVITPGFINAHTHLQLTKLEKDNQSLSEVSFVEWILSVIKKYSKFANYEKIESLKLGIKKSIESGTTCVAQMSKEIEFFDVFSQSPIKACLFLELFAGSELSSEHVFESLKFNISKLAQKDFTNISTGVAPHAPYTVHSALWSKVSEYALDKGLLVHTHFAESKEEIDWFAQKGTDLDQISNAVRGEKVFPEKKYNNPVDFLRDKGLLNDRLLLAHCNQLSVEQLSELAQAGINLVLCPRSNMKLHNKTLCVESVMALFGDRVAVATDSLYSNDDLNLLSELAFVYKNSNLSTLALLDLITINAAKVLELDHKIGSLKKGKDADFLVFGLDNDEDYNALLTKDKPESVYINGDKVV